MSTQFYSVSTGTQYPMVGSQLHTPQSVFQHAMSHQQVNDYLHNEAQWLGMPQIPPMSMPWAAPSSQQPDLVYFTGRQASYEINKESYKSFKRKMTDFTDLRPVKQRITEEKMTQHFKELNIGNTNSCEAGPSTNVITNPQNLDQSSCLMSSLDSNNSGCEPRLVISDEIRRLQEEPILPSSLLNQSISKLERPSMALVLWEPPSKHLRIFPRNTQTPASSDDSNNGDHINTAVISGNNNNQSVPDFNQTMQININNSTLEPMDL